MAKKIVVTGAGGLIGSHLVEQILEAGHECVAIVRPGSKTGLRDGVQRVEVDLDATGGFDHGVLPGECDAVVYLAQSNGYRNLPYEAGSVFQVNVVSVAAMLEHARRAGASHFVYASTGSIYCSTEKVITEKSEIICDGRGRNLYPWSKLTGETILQSYSDDLHAIALRYFFVYGAGANIGMLIPRTVESVRNGASIGLQRPDGCIVVPTHADDAAAACLRSLSLERSDLFNIAGPEPTSLRNIADTAGDLLGIDPIYSPMDGVPVEFRVDISRMKRELGIEPVGFRQGLERTLRDQQAGGRA